MSQPSNTWPALDFNAYRDTYETLHHWLQIVGKVRLKTMPWQNHSWHVPLYVSTIGYSTNPIPYQGRIIQIDFDFKQHQLMVTCSTAGSLSFPLAPMTVADFYQTLFATLKQLGINVNIHARPNEMEPAIPFAENTVNHAYDPTAAHALWQAMLRANEVFNRFRSDFVGKASPVHLFWGAFDLAVTRFSGRSAPLHQGNMPNMPQEVMQEAYSQEVSSAGFWPGSKEFPHPVFYAYAYPSDEAFSTQPVRPEQAFYSSDLGEFVLKYADVQAADNPDAVLYDFLQTTYEAAANTSEWDREKLEK